MRWSDFNGLDLMVSLSNHEPVAGRRAYREAMGSTRYSFSKPSQPKRLLFGKLFGAADPA